MGLLTVTGSITVPAGKTLASATIRVSYLEEYSDGTARYPRVYDLDYDTVNNRWKPGGTANGTLAYIPGADLGDPGPVAVFTEAQRYSDNSSQTRQWTQNVLATAADEWDYTALMPDYWQLGTVATATLYPAATGRLLRYGAGAPASSLGVVGDFYIDTTNSRLYGPKLPAGWGSYISIIGPTGATGATGATGPTGATGANGVFSGSETIETAIETGDYLYFTDASASNAPKRITAANAMSEIVDDRVANLIVAGSNITKTYDDNAGTLTIAGVGSVAATIDVITATQTGGSGWLLPTGAKSVHIVCIGGGGGAGGGGRNTGSTSNGGAGGAGGGSARVEARLPASLIGTPGTTRVDITIGAGGNGGSGQTSGAAATNGTDGGTTSFGTLVYALGGKLGTAGSGATSGTAGLGALTYTGNPDGRVTPSNGGQGGLSTTTDIARSFLAATGGGGGGGDGGTTADGKAGNAGSPLYLNSTGVAGSDGTLGTGTTTANATAAAGGAGTSRSGSTYAGGGGGGGGAQNATTGTTGVGGAGGAGGAPGGGGGAGGGARSTSTAAGAGGAGGRGEVVITVYY